MVRGQLTLFGDFRFTLAEPDSHALQTWGPRRLPLLLAYLALHLDRPLDREHVAFRLWPQEPEAGALAHLRQQLHQLRVLLLDQGWPAHLLESGSSHVRLHSHPALRIDVWRFQELAEHPEGWDQAVALYAGDLLEPLGALDWILPLRVRFRERVQQMLLALAQDALRRCVPEQARRYTARLLALDPLREDGHRLHMEALAAAGRRVEALQHFQELHRRMTEEWGTQPGPALMALAQALRNGRLHPTPSPRPSGSPGCVSPPSEARLVGRDREWMELERALASARRGQGGALVVAGENGLGRTYLVETWLAHRRDAIRALRVTCFPQQPTSQAWLDLVAQLQERGQPSGDRPAHHPIRWAARQLLARVRHGQVPVVLFVQDLHHGDANTWEAWAYLAVRCHRIPLVLVTTVAPAALDSPNRRHLRSLRRRGHVRWFHLRPLELEETGTLVRLYLDRTPPPTFVEALHRVSEGHPYFAVAYVQAMAAEDVEAWRLPAMPPSVRQVLGDVWSALPPGARSVLSAALALPQPFEWPELIQATPHMDDGARVAALEQCLRRGVLKATDEGYQVAHNQIAALLRLEKGTE